MDDKSYNSSFTDEDCISKYKQNLSLSEGYFPYEDNIDWKSSTSSEDSTSEDSFCYFLPPVQESSMTESGRKSMGTQEQVHESEELCGLPIVRVVDVYLGSHYENALATLDLHRDYQWMDKYPKGRMNKILWKLEVLMRYFKVFPDNLEDDDDEDEDDEDEDNDNEDEDYEKYDTDCDEDYDDDDDDDEDEDYENYDTDCDEDYDEDEDNDDEMISQETDTEDTLSVSSGQTTEGDTPSHSGTTSCLNIRSIVHWFRKRVFSSRKGRKCPNTAYKDPSLPESKKLCFLRGKRIQPQ